LNPIIEPGGVKALYYTTLSCGHAWADLLLEFTEEVALSDLGRVASGSEIVGNLSRFASSHGLNRLSQEDVLRYFVTDHLLDANRSAGFSPDSSQGSCGLVGKLLAHCALWPLGPELSLCLPKREISLRGTRDMGGEGLPFLHRHLVFLLPVSAKLHESLRQSLISNKLFVASVACIGSELEFPILPQDTK